MDLTIILTLVASVGAIVGTNIALITWLRADMKAFEAEVRSWREELHKESKDFHARLCVIEAERNKLRIYT